MNDASIKVKQQIVEKIKSCTNILVTVSRNPTVDDLSAAIGLTAMLNNMGKHATSIFSGIIPPAISFLEPDKVFEESADSLRDFIIALDKEKADHLRYKIEGDVVKIFITPYRTTITDADLQFSQGDFNVELVIALGVADQQNLDNAISAYGQIIKDVTIATFSSGENVSQLGTLDWHDDQASSLCEMITSISESLKTDKQLLDKQISTALLTGIVFATDRFSNLRTTSKVMTMAAQLMAAGADQQLIAAKLNESHTVGPGAPASVSLIKDMSESDGSVEMQMIVDKDAPPSEPEPSEPGTLKISHDEPEEEVIPATSTLPPEPDVTANPVAVEPIVSAPDSTLPTTIQPPTLGGTLNATTDQAAEDNRLAVEDQKNKTILSHSYLTGSEPDVGASINSVGQESAGNTNVDIFAAPPPVIDRPSDGVDTTAPVAEAVVSPENLVSTLPPEQPPVSSTLSELESSRDNDEALAASKSISGSKQVIMPLSDPADLGLPMPPALPDFSSLPPIAPGSPTGGSSFDFAANSLASSPSVGVPQQISTDPSQFHIPG